MSNSEKNGDDSTRDWKNRVSVVLVTFNSADVIGSSLKSVPSGLDVVVVDNASSDDSVAIAREAGAQCICNKKNFGFGRAANIGASKFDSEFILFLNPDANLHVDTLERLVASASLHLDAAAIAPRLVNADDQLPWRFSSILHPYTVSNPSPVEPVAACCVPLLTGAVLLCRRTAFEAVGGFDEAIFLYHEDDDLCLRLVRAGWSLIYDPDIEAFHASGKSSRRSLPLVRFKSEQRIMSRAYVSEKYGLVFDYGREMRRSVKRLLIAIATFDSGRRSAALGRFDALRRLEMRQDKNEKAGALSSKHSIE